MKSRVFLISVLLLFSCLSVQACIEWGYVKPRHHWIFYTGYYQNDGEWKKALDMRFKEENISFWHEYVGKHVSREAIEQGLYKEYLLDAHTQNDFFRYLIDHHDTLALQYWRCLKAADPASVKEYRWRKSIWFYKPNSWETSWADTAKESWVDMSIPQIRELDEQCIQPCKDKNIRNRYLLQLMRKTFYQNDYQACVAFWEKYGKQVPKSALRTQCLNYYAGALRKLNKGAESDIVYSEIGYYCAYSCYYPDELREIYCLQPNCKGFEFMVQQFVNDYFDHPQPYNAKAFNKLADDIVREKKNSNPALWKSAQAALAYIDHDTDKALKLLSEAEGLKGSKVAKENIRMMRILFNSTRTDLDSLYEELLYPDLKWLTDNIKKDLRKVDMTKWDDDFTRDLFYGLYGEYNIFNSNLALHRVKVFRRALFLGILPHFERLGRQDKCLAYTALYNNVFPYVHHYDEGELHNFIDATSIQTVLQYTAMLQSGGQNQIEKYLAQNGCGLIYCYDVLGTKYMREEKYSSAIRYFSKVPTAFQKAQNISEFINENHNPFSEKWITNVKEQGNYNLSFDPVEEYSQNPNKLTFCQLMLRMQKNRLQAKTEEERAKSAYAYAVGLYQSSKGYAWALTNYWMNLCDEDFFLDDGRSCYDYEEQTSEEKAKRQYMEQVQNRVDKVLDDALKHKGDRVFTLKCTILHGKYRTQWREPNRQSRQKKFVTEVRNSLCDNISDYCYTPNKTWENSIWYY